MPDVVMPRLSDSMEEGTILKWLKQDGDSVARGDELAEIETDKANMTYEADADGVLSIVAPEGETLPVGELIARIGEPREDAARGGEKPERAPEEAEAQPAEERPREREAVAAEARAADPATAERPREGDGRAQAPASPSEGHPAPAPERDGTDGRVKASPIARRMARELGVALERIRGSGPGGRIVKADVEQAARGGEERAPEPEPVPEPAPAAAAEPAEAPAPAAPPERPRVPEAATAKGETRVEELSRLQQTVARRMAESKATAPDFVLSVEVDMEEAVALRARLKDLAGDEPVPTFNDLVVKASARALREHPRANGAYRDGRFELYSRINVGIAVAAQDSLVVPTVFDADAKSLGEIARKTRALVERVRAGKITPPELSGGTFTVSNLGMYGIRSFSAVINPPQAAILAVGELGPRAVAREGVVVPRQTMSMTLACDHRILYGAEAAEFLARIRALLEQPLALAL